MLRWLKKYFIPHPGNDHKPHIFRTRGRLVLLSGALLVEILFVASVLLLTRTNFLAEVMVNVLVDETNQNRAVAGVQTLKANPLLERAAQEKADDMAAKSYFAHVSPDGKTPWYWLDRVGYNFSSAGENLAVNFFDSTDIENAWMNSPGHRENILNPKYTEIGIATARGMYQGKETVYVVQFFGNPAATDNLSAPKVVSAKNASQEKFLAVKGGEVKPETAPAPLPPAAQAAPLSIANPIASPRNAANMFYFMLIAFVVAALAIAVFVEIRIQHTAPILSGLLLILILSGVVYVNFMVATVSQIL